MVRQVLGLVKLVMKDAKRNRRRQILLRLQRIVRRKSNQKNQIQQVLLRVALDKEFLRSQTGV
jgi:hypothetical protein